MLKKGMKFDLSPSRTLKEEIVAKVEGTSLGYANQGIAEEARARTSCLIKRAPKRNESREEWKAISNLRKDKNVVILEADKGNATVVMDSIDYDKRSYGIDR